MFRCDRIGSAEPDEETEPIDLADVDLKNRFSVLAPPEDMLELYIELTEKGVEQFGSVKWPYIELHRREDGSGVLSGYISKRDLSFFSGHLISYGREAVIKKPSELIQKTKEVLIDMLNQYS